MKKILFVTSNLMPVPAVKGGAVETLLQIMAEENEKEKKAELYILCRYDSEAEKISRLYKHTHILFYKSFKELSVFKDLSYLKILVGYFFHVLKHNLKSYSFSCNRYSYTAYKLAGFYGIDEIVIEGGVYNDYLIFQNGWERNHIYAHFHRSVDSSEIYEKVYGNTISVSEFIRNYFVQGLNKESTLNNYVLMNCANDKNFDRIVNDDDLLAIRKEHNIEPSDFVVFFSGRVREEKGVLELVNAIYQLNNSKIKLIIAGTSLYSDGTETEYVKEIKEIAGHSNNRIICVGYIPNKDIINYSSICSAWCIPSVYEEPGALVVMEAMLSGLPLIITGSGGMLEYANEKCSIIAKRDDLIENLKNAVLRLYNDPQLCAEMSKESKKCVKQFTRKKFYNDFMKILDCS